MPDPPTYSQLVALLAIAVMVVWAVLWLGDLYLEQTP